MSVVICLEEDSPDSDEVWVRIDGMPYNQIFIEKFKALIPAKERSWDGESKTWAFLADYQVEVINLLEEVFPDAEIES